MKSSANENIKIPLIWLSIESLIVLIYNVIGFYFSILIYKETNSALIMATSVLLGISPSIYLSFYSGKSIDKHGYRNVILAAQISILIIYIFYYFTFSIFSVNLYLILIIITLRSCISSYHTLAIMTAIPEVVSKEKVRKTYGIEMFMVNSTQIGAPIIAGIIYGYISLYTLVMYAILLSLIGLLSTFYYLPNKKFIKKNKSTVIFLGYKNFIMNNRYLKSLLAFFSIFNAINGVSSVFITAYILMVFKDSSSSLSTFNTILAIGTMLGTLYSIKEFKISPFIVISGCCIICALLGRLAIPYSDDLIVISIFVGIRAAVIPVINMANQMIWIDNTNSCNRAGVFGFRRLVAQGLYPLITASYLVVTKLLNFNLDIVALKNVFIFSGLIEIIISVTLIYIYLKYLRLDMPDLV